MLTSCGADMCWLESQATLRVCERMTRSRRVAWRLLVRLSIVQDRRCPSECIDFAIKMADPQHKARPSENRELPVDTVLQRAKPHPPYGEHIIADLTDDEADAFLEAALR